MSKSVVVDLFCGKGGWSRGLIDAGFHAIGFDIADMGGYPGELVLQDILTLHGSQFRNVAGIVASPPCQKYSYMAMPWTRAKEMAANYRAHPELIESELNVLFNACFRIQREASEAAGHHIPMVVENVKGAQPWVGRAAWHYGSFYLWGDVPALMPMTRSRKVPGFNFHQHEKTGKPGGSFQSAAVKGMSGLRGASHPAGNGGRDLGGPNDPRRFNSRSAGRKEASARIAMIPYDLALHIGRCFL